MKSKKIIIFLFLLLMTLFQSCEQDKIDNYKQEAGVYFDPQTSISVYTFTENLDKIEVGYDYINIPVLISGVAVDKEREFEVSFMKEDTLHTAEDGMIELSKGLVRANAYGGHIKVKINYSHKLDDSVYIARIRILPSKEFPAVDLNSRNLSINFGNIFTQPENWAQLKRHFGNVYSNSWYKWVLKTSGYSSLPYKYSRGSDQAGITPEEALRWPMRLEEIQSISAKVKIALQKYNNDNPGKEMKHEDGEKKDELVVM